MSFDLASRGSRAWLEVVYEGDEILPDLRERLEETVRNTYMEVLRVKNSRIIDRVLAQAGDEETLEDLEVEDVFLRCLDVREVPEDQRSELLTAYREAVQSVHEDDGQAE